jgi:TonB family protein
VSDLLWLIESAVRLTVLCLAAGTLVALTRPRPAVELRIWTVVLAAAVCLPLLGRIVDLFGVSVVVPDGPLTQVVDAQAVMFRALSDPAGAFGWVPRGLIGVYALGATVLLARVGLGWLRITQLRRKAARVEGQPFLESRVLRIPAVVGFGRPAIVLPPEWREWPADTLAAALAHEGAHARRFDNIVITLAHLHRAVHWINPLSWWLAARLSTLVEQAADESALEAGCDRADYAGVLLSFAAAVSTAGGRLTPAGPISPMAGRAGRSMTDRIDRVLNWKGSVPMSRIRLALIVVVLAVASVAAYAVSLQSIDIHVETTPAVFTPEGLMPPSPPKTPPDVSHIPIPSDDAAPVVLERKSPRYTAAAMRAKIEGVVELEVDINVDGAVTAARVIKSLDSVHGLDGNAIDAALQWKFKPALENGVPVARTVTLQMEFRLH